MSSRKSREIDDGCGPGEELAVARHELRRARGAFGIDDDLNRRVHAPGGRAGTMNVTTGEVTVEREELREEVLRVLQHYAFNSWS